MGPRVPPLPPDAPDWMIEQRRQHIEEQLAGMYAGADRLWLIFGVAMAVVGVAGVVALSIGWIA